MTDSTDLTPRGPLGYRNRAAWEQDLEDRGTYEFAIYSDTDFTGEILSGLGPVKVLNTIPIASRRSTSAAVPALRLRITFHESDTESETDWSKTSDPHWHGGHVDDEIAAILSLGLGARIRSGGLAREFPLDGDPLGMPREFDHRVPYVPPHQDPGIIPSASVRQNLDIAKPLITQYFALSPDEAVVLLRSARFYQAGLWAAEDDPEYAWLKFVSAVEVVADHWWRGESEPTELLESWNPKLCESLRAAGGESLVREVADALLPVTRSTKKFLSFLSHFGPGPPEDRPDVHAQVEWSKLNGALKMVYAYRSSALHAGKPLPGPLMEPPRMAGGLQEIPLGLASAQGDSIWLKEDLPMLLHVFERIARLSIKAWAETAVASAQVG
jgi:hypothetical protein